MHSRAHFRILGVPVRVEPLFIIVALLFAVRIQQVWLIFAVAVLVFISILVHELGHAFVYRVLGQRSAVVLHGFGGFTVPADGGRRALSKGRSIAVSLAGILSQLLLLYLPARFLLNTEWAVDQQMMWAFEDADGNFAFNWFPVLYYTQFINLWWAVFNALPIRPLDGGHVAEELIGHENACKVSIGAAAVAALLALTHDPMYLIVALLMGFFGFQNYRELKAGMPSDMFDVEAPESPGGRGQGRGQGRGRGRGSGGGPTGMGGSSAKGNRPEKGGKGRGRGRGRQRSGHLSAVPPPADTNFAHGTGASADMEASIWNELREGDVDRAAAMLYQSGSDNGFLKGSVALAQGHTEIGVELIEAAYLKEPDGPPNLVLAGLLARTDQAVTLTEELVTDGSVGLTAAGSLQTHLHYDKRFGAAARVGELVFAAGPPSPAQTAFETACAWSRAGDIEEGLRWAEAAIDAGFRAPAILDKEPDLLEVRSHPGWSAVRAKLDD